MRPAWRGGLIVAGWGVLACGPSVGEEVAFEELCGVEGPVHVLALEDDEAVTGRTSSAARFGDRWLYAVQRFDREIVDVDEAGLWGRYRAVPQLDARIESVDRCGEDRRVVAEGIDDILAPAEEDGPWLGYRRDTGILYLFDPDGRFAAMPLARPRHYRRQIVDGRSVIVHRDDEHDLVRFTIDGGEVATQVLAADVAQTSLLREWPTPPAFIFVLHDDGELVELSLASGETTPVLSGVGWFSGGGDPRWVVWVPGEPQDFGSTLPTGVILFDRSTGEQRPLGSGAPTMAQIFDNHVVAETVDDEGRRLQTTFIALPAIESITLDGTWWWFGEGNDGRFGAIDAGAPFDEQGYVLGPVDGELRELAGPMPARAGGDGALWSRDASAYAELGSDETGRPYDVVRFSLAMLEAEVVDRRIWSDVELPGDRFVDVRAREAGDPVGDLVIVDGEDGRAQTIDHDVSPLFPTLEPHTPDIMRPWATDEIVYQLRAPGSDRTGLWRVRP